MNTLILVLAGCALGALCVWLISQERRSRAKTQAQVAERQLQRDAARCQAIEEGLRDWLKTLKLPALEERTQLEVAARRLRIVLVERLMNGPVVR